MNIKKHEQEKLYLAEQIPPLLLKDVELKDPEVIADAFNTFFLTITENLKLHQEVRRDAISFLKEALPRKFPDIKTIPAAELEIKMIWESLFPGLTLKTLADLI
jgi:uncharacterized protein (DUF2225 family)